MKKHVSEMSDKELDDFLKKLSGSKEIPFQPQDWKNMEKRLDQRKPAPLNGYKYGLMATILILTFLMGFWWVNSSADLTGAHDFAMGDNNLKPDNPNRSEIRLPDPDLKKENILYPQKNQKGLFNQISLPNEHHQKEYLLGSDNRVERQFIIPIDYDRALINKKNLINDVRPILNKDHQKFQTSKSPLITKSPLSQKRSLSIALMVAPDVSAINFNHIQKAGRSLAVNLEYFIHPKWSINSGLVHAFKTYYSKEGYWPGYNGMHDELLGDCRILEIPMNIRYYPLQGLKSNWYLSSGISSYFMMSESYTLIQKSYNGPPYAKELEIKGRNKHPFAVFNLGIGYERKLNHHFSVQVEPYLRLPWGKIGEGEINLKSTGILLGLKYYK